jgi:hypothetical protein
MSPLTIYLKSLSVIGTGIVHAQVREPVMRIDWQVVQVSAFLWHRA